MLFTFQEQGKLFNLSDLNFTHSCTFGDIYLVCELMETDLNRVIRSKQKLQIEHIQYFIY